MWIIPGHSIPMAVSLLDAGEEARPVGLAPPPPGGSAWVDRHGGLNPAYEVRWFRFGWGGALRDAGLLLEFRTRPAASRFLLHFRIDSAAMATLRHVLAVVSVLSTIHCHRQSRYLNTRCENAHRPTRQREYRMQGFTSVGHAPRFLSAYGPITQHFRPRRHLLSAVDYRQEMRKQCTSWAEVTGTERVA